MQGKAPGTSMFVQSLRGDPFRVSNVICYRYTVFLITLRARIRERASNSYYFHVSSIIYTFWTVP